MKTYANITNGLAFPHDSVCHFMSTHAHKYSMGYFRIDAMPYGAVIELLQGRAIKIVDATSKNKELTDALKFGLTTWVLVFNRAIRNQIVVAPWMTQEMVMAANRSKVAAKLVKRIRRLAIIFGNCGPVKIGENEQVQVRCYKNFRYVDKPEEIARRVCQLPTL